MEIYSISGLFRATIFLFQTGVRLALLNLQLGVRAQRKLLATVPRSGGFFLHIPPPPDVRLKDVQLRVEVFRRD
jgi:hypothetical protein